MPKNYSVFTADIKFNISPSINEIVKDLGKLSAASTRTARKLEDNFAIAESSIAKLQATLSKSSGSAGFNAIGNQAVKMASDIIDAFNDLEVHSAQTWDKIRKAGIEQMAELRKELVGQSIIPDMIDDIIDHFERLSPAMQEENQRLLNDFKKLQREYNKNVLKTTAQDQARFAGIRQQVQAASKTPFAQSELSGMFSAKRYKDIAPVIAEINKQFGRTFLDDDSLNNLRQKFVDLLSDIQAESKKANINTVLGQQLLDIQAQLQPFENAFLQTFDDIADGSTTSAKRMAASLESVLRQLPAKDPFTILAKQRKTELTKGIAEAAANREEYLGGRNISELTKQELKDIKTINDAYDAQIQLLQQLGQQAVDAFTKSTQAKETDIAATKKQKEEQKALAKLEADEIAFNEKIRRARAVREGAATQVGPSGVKGAIAGYNTLVDSIAKVREGNLGLVGSFGEILKGASAFQAGTKDVFTGLNFALADSEGGMNKLGTVAIGLRRTLFGIQGPTDEVDGTMRKVATTLDWVANQFGRTSRVANEWAQTAAELASQASAANISYGDSFQNLAEAAKDAGINITRDMGKINAANREARQRFDEIQATLEGGGTLKKGIFQAQIKAVDALANSFNNLEVKGLIPTNQQLDEMQSELEQLADQESLEAKQLKARIRRLKQVRDEYDATTDILRQNRQTIQEIQVAVNNSEKGSKTAVGKITGYFKNMFNKVKGGKSAIDGNSEALFQAGNRARDFGEKTSAMTKNIERAGKAASVFKDVMLGTFAGNLLFAGLQRVTGFFGGMINSVQGFARQLQSEFFQANNLVQNFEVTLKQMLTGYDEQTVKKALQGTDEFIRKIIAVTPFELATGQAAFQQLVTSGFDPKEWLLPAADAAAAMNKEMGWLINALQRLRSGSKGMAVDMLRDFGIPVQQVGVWVDATSGAVLDFADVAGKTDEQLRASGATYKQWAFDAAGSLEQAPIEALDILNGYLKQNAIFAGASAARSRTLTGVLSNMQDTLTKLLTGFGKPVFQAITDALTDVLVVVDQMMVVIEPFVTLIGEQVGKALTNLWTWLLGLSDPLESVSSGLASMGAALESVTDAVKKNQLKKIGDAIVQKIKPALQVILLLLRGEWSTAWGLVLSKAKDTISKLATFFRTTGKDAFRWGVDLIKQIAKGITDAAKTLIRGAVTAVSSAISSFLKPGSPPEEGPLSTIDQWGQGLMESFAEGFKLADLDFLSTILDPIVEALGITSTDQFKAVRADIIALIAGINETGSINEELWNKISQQLGASNQTLAEYIRLNLELKAVTKEVADAEAAGFVSEELQEKLENAQLAVELKEQELQLEEQIASSSENAVEDAKKQAEEERKRLELRRKVGLITQQEYLEGLREIEASLAEAAVQEGDEEAAKKSAENIKDLNIKSLEEQQKANLDMLEKKRKLGLLTEEEYLAERANLEKQFAENVLAAGDEEAAKKAAATAKEYEEKALEEQKRLQVKAAEEDFKRQLEFLKKKRDAGLLTEEEYQKARIDLVKNFIDQQLQLEQPIDGDIAKLREFEEQFKELTKIEIAKPAETLAGFAKDVTGEFEKLMGELSNELDDIGSSTWAEVKETFVTEFGPVWDEIKNTFGIGGGTSGGSFDQLATNLITSLRNTLNNMWEGQGGIQEFINQKITRLWIWLGGPDSPLRKLDNVLGNMASGIQSWVDKNQPLLESLGAAVATAMWEGVKGAFSAEGGGNVLQVLGSIVDNVYSILDGFLSGAEATIRGGLEKVLVAILGEKWGTRIAESLAHEIKYVFLTMINPFASIITRLKEFFVQFGDILAIATQDGIGIFDGFALKVLEIFNNLYMWLVGASIVPDTVNAILGWYDFLVNGVVSRVTNLRDSVVGLFNDIIERANAALSAITSTISETASSVADSAIPDWVKRWIPGYATGIMDVPQDMIAQIHKGEMILPADVASTLRAGMNVAPANVSNNTNSVSNIFNQGAFAGAFPNVKNASDAQGVMAEIQRQIQLGGLKASTV